MTGNPPEDKNLIAVELDKERRREINDVKKRMEDFLRGQIEIEHELKIVAKNQDHLKERFEQGVSKTVRDIDQKLDKFMIEWGKKVREDELRDSAIVETRKELSTTNKRMDTVYSIFARFALAVGGGLTLAFLIWALAKVGIGGTP